MMLKKMLTLMLMLLLVPSGLAQDDVDEAVGTVQDSLGVSCPAGYRCVAVLDCLPCDYGSYMEDGDSSACTSCPPGCTTLRKGATSSKECVPWCPEGYEESADGKTCSMCPAGYYKSSWENELCTECPNMEEVDTNIVGRTSLADCYTTSATSKPSTSSTQSSTSSTTSPTTSTTTSTTTSPTTSSITSPTTSTTTSTTTSPSTSTTTSSTTSTTTSTTTTTPPTLGHSATVQGRLEFVPEGISNSVKWDQLTEADQDTDTVYAGATWVLDVIQNSGLATVDDITDIEFVENGDTVTAKYVFEYTTTDDNLKPQAFTDAVVTDMGNADGVYADVSNSVTVDSSSVHHGYYFDYTGDLNEDGCPLIGCTIVSYYSSGACEQFCQCDHGKWVKHDCPAGTLFSNAIAVCDHAINVVCWDTTSDGGISGNATEAPPP